MRRALLLLVALGTLWSVECAPRGSEYGASYGYQGARLARFSSFQGNNGTISRVTTDATHPFPDAAPPVLRAIAPKAGPKEGGTTLTITGSGFRRSKNLKVRFLSPQAGPRVLNRADEA